MSFQTLTLNRSIHFHAYLELCKPKVVLTMLVTMNVGALLAKAGSPDIALLLLTNIGVAFCSASGAVMNHCIEVSSDKKMQRTCNRPIVTGRVPLSKACSFAALLGILGFLLLWYWVNPLVAAVTVTAMIGYGIFYTGFLKPATPQNIVIGGLAGAVPPLLGWLSVTPSFDPMPMMLVTIIFLWTPPHFWSLAIAKKNEYAATKLPMMPVTHGCKLTALHALLYSILMVVATWLPYLGHHLGPYYLIMSTLANILFLRAAWRLWKKPEEIRAWYLFKVSIIYILWLFPIMLMDHFA